MRMQGFSAVFPKKDLPLKFMSQNYIACSWRNTSAVIHLSFIEKGKKSLENYYIVSLDC